MMRRILSLAALCAVSIAVPAQLGAQDQYEGNIYPNRVDITRYIHVFDGNDTVRLAEMQVSLYFEVETDYVYPTVTIQPSDISVEWVGSKSVADYKATFPGREPNFTDTSQASAESAIRTRAETSIDMIRGEVRDQLPETYEQGSQRIAFDAFDRSCAVTLYLSEGSRYGGALGEDARSDC
ncbi:MAG: hypothetical protein AAFQ90_10910 [Pseudomonadota bacterium]